MHGIFQSKKKQTKVNIFCWTFIYILNLSSINRGQILDMIIFGKSQYQLNLKEDDNRRNYKYNRIWCEHPVFQSPFCEFSRSCMQDRS